MTDQTRLQSFIEISVNTGIGFFIAMGVQTLVFPFYGLTVSHTTNFQMTAIFTFVSMIRSFAIRRFFNNNIGAVIVKKIKSIIHLWKQNNKINIF
jgi:hypothetical protein